MAMLPAVLVFGASVAYAKPGDFDPSFGTGGVTINQLSPAPKPNSVGADVAPAPEGKVVVAGEIADLEGRGAVGVARYLANGQLDPTFGSGGAVIYQFGEGGAKAASVAYYSGLAVMPDGRIVLAGFASDKEGNRQTLVARLKASGELDTTFAGGKVIKQFGEGEKPSSELFGLLLQPDGRVVVTGGCSCGAEGRREFLAERLTATGEADGTFGTAGVFKSQVGLSAKSTSVGADVISVAGEYVFSVQATDTETSYGFAVLKLTAKGELNLGFGSGGKTLKQPSQHPGFSTAPYRVVAQSDGKLVLGGAAPFDEPLHPALALMRFTASGELDPTFGTGGTTLTQLSSAASPTSLGVGLVVQHDDRLVLPGLAVVDSKSDSIPTVARYTANGALDPTFAENGVLQRQLGTGETPTSALIGGAIDPAGRLLVAGGAGASTSAYSLLVGRIVLEEPPPPPPPPAAPPGVQTPIPPGNTLVTPAIAGIEIGGLTLTMDSHGNVTLKLSSKVAESGIVTLKSLASFKASAKAAPLVLGSAKFNLLAGPVQRVKVHLSKRAQALVRRLGNLRAKVTMLATAGSQSRTTTARVTIRSAKRAAKHH
jgi:uncharacterized delta-60 repeat protein